MRGIQPSWISVSLGRDGRGWPRDGRAVRAGPWAACWVVRLRRPKVLAAPTSPAQPPPVRSSCPVRSRSRHQRGPRAPGPRRAARPPRHAPPPALCLRHVFSAAGRPLRVLSWSTAADRARNGGARWPGARAAGPAAQVAAGAAGADAGGAASPDGPLVPALRDSLRAVIDATFKHPKASLGLLVYERGRRLLVERPLTEQPDEVVLALARARAPAQRRCEPFFPTRWAPA